MYHLLWKMSSRTLGPRLPVRQMEQTPFSLFSGIFVLALTLPLVHLFAEIKELSVLLSCLDIYKRISLHALRGVTSDSAAHAWQKPGCKRCSSWGLTEGLGVHPWGAQVCFQDDNGSPPKRGSWSDTVRKHRVKANLAYLLLIWWFPREAYHFSNVFDHKIFFVGYLLG